MGPPAFHLLGLASWVPDELFSGENGSLRDMTATLPEERFVLPSPASRAPPGTHSLSQPSSAHTILPPNTLSSFRDKGWPALETVSYKITHSCPQVRCEGGPGLTSCPSAFLSQSLFSHCLVAWIGSVPYRLRPMNRAGFQLVL